MNIDKMSGRSSTNIFGMICDNWKWDIAYYCFISDVFLSCFALLFADMELLTAVCLLIQFVY